MQVITVRKVVLRPDLQPIEAIRLKDGTKGASVRSMCLLLDVARQGQVQRIKRTPDLVAALRQVSLPTSAGPRVFDVLLTHAISLWLMTFAAGRLTPHKQELVTFMKAHAVEAIERAFSDQDDSAVMEELSPAIDAWEQVQAGFVAIAAGIGQLQGSLRSMVKLYCSV